MTEYSYTDTSTGGPRSPLFGTATFSTLTATQTPLSPSRASTSSRSLTPTPSSYDSDEGSSGPHMRRITMSPSASAVNSYTYSDTYSDTYTEGNSIDDAAEVEAALTQIDDELDDAPWSRDPPNVGHSIYSTYSGAVSGVDTLGTADFYSAPSTFLDPNRQRLSTISEHTENASSRPTSFAQTHPAEGPGSRPITLYSNTSGDANRLSAHLARPISPLHIRSSTEPPGGTPTTRPVTPGRGVTTVPGRRVGELIATFEDRKSVTPEAASSPFRHTRTTSAPSGPRSPSPYTTSNTQTASFTTSYGYGTGSFTSTGTGYGYGSRPSSPTKSRSGSSVTGTGSLLSPPPGDYTSTYYSSRYTPSSVSQTYSRSGTSTYTGGAGSSTVTGTGTGTYTGTYTGTNTHTFTSLTGTTQTPTTSSLRRPQTSPRSPLTSVRNIVQAWKERTPSLSKTAKSGSVLSTSDPSPPGQEGLFSMRRRAERGSLRLRDGVKRRNSDGSTGEGAEGGREGESSSSGMGLLPPSFDIGDLSQYGGISNGKEPIRIGDLWYLNVHASPPYAWQRCQALLYPHMLLLSWIAPGGGRGVVTLDLLNCTEVRSAPSPTHIEAQDDVGTLAAKEQYIEGGSLMEVLTPFQLLYADGVERLAAESPRERVRWVSAIWEVMNQSVNLPDRSDTRSPTGSIRTIRSITSTSTSQSGSAAGSGSASTIYVPPWDSIPDMSDVHSMTSRTGTFTGTGTRTFTTTTGLTRTTTDDSAISTSITGSGTVTSYLNNYSDPRRIAPSRSSSLRRTASLTDIDEEFESALARRAENSRGGLGFGLGLVGLGSMFGLGGSGSPVTVSSGPREGRDVRITPPPSRRSRSRPRSDFTSTSTTRSSDLSDEHFFSAGSGETGTAPTSSWYSSSGFTKDLTTNATTSNGLSASSGTGVEIVSGSGTNIVPSTLSFRGTASNSMLGDSHSGSGSYTYDTSYGSGSGSSSTLTRSGGVRRRTRSYISSGTGSGSGTYTSERENSASDSYTYSGAYSGGYTGTGGLSTLESYSYSYSDDSNTRSRSVTPTPSSVSGPRSQVSRVTMRTEESDTSEKSLEVPILSSGSSSYSTAKSPATSFASLPSIPSEADYATAEICETEYQTMDVCTSDLGKSFTEYETVDICPTEPTEYITASVCTSEVEADYLTAQCIKDRAAQEADVISITSPSELPTIPGSDIGEETEDMEAVLPEDVPLPPSTIYSPTVSSITISSPLIPEPPSEPLATVASPSTMSMSVSSGTTPSLSLSLPGPSPITPVQISPLSSVSSPTESSVTPTSLSDVGRLTVPSTIQPPSTELSSSPSLPESVWAPETDQSYESSVLRASPSVQSQAIPEGPDFSFETSFLRPTTSAMTVSSESLSMLTPITESSISEEESEESSLSTSEVTPTMSLPPSVPSPSPITFSRTVSSLARTPSTISSVSSISMTSSRMAPSVFEVPYSPSTEPSLLSTEMSPPTISPRNIPLPASPSPSSISSVTTPSVTMSVSVTTPRGSTPSVHSIIETIPSEHTPIPPIQPSNILTHDVNMLLQYLHGVDEMRGLENREIIDNMREMRDELRELADMLVHQPEPQPQQQIQLQIQPQAPPRQVVMTPQQHQQVAPREAPAPSLPETRDESVEAEEEVPPPVPHKDVSVGGSSIISYGPRDMPTPRIVAPQPRLLTPPPIRLASPDTLTETMSFLSSHHSDDISFMESESYPMRAGSPMWSESSPSSSESSSPSSPSSPSSEATEHSISDVSSLSYSPDVQAEVPLQVPAPIQVPPPIPRAEPVSPTLSTSSVSTARPVPPLNIGQLRDMLDRVMNQIADLEAGQNHTHNLLGNLPQPVDSQNQEMCDKLRRIEDMLQRLLAQPQPQPTTIQIPMPVPQPATYVPAPAPPPAPAPQERDELPPPEESEVSSDVTDDSEFFRRLQTLRDEYRREQPIHMPQPSRPVGPSFEEQLADMLAAPAPPAPQTIQPPPELVPLVYRPGPRQSRPRSASPTFETDIPRRARSVPIPTTEPVRFERPDGLPRVRRVQRPRQRPHPTREEDVESQYVTPMEPAPERTPQPARRRRQGTDGFHGSQPVLRPPTAPADPGRAEETLPATWYTERPQPQPTTPGVVPPPGAFAPATAPSAPAAVPPPTVVQLPPTFDDILALLRESRLAHVATIEQQREIMRYLHGLNEWLERDVHDRHSEIQSVSARVDSLGDVVNQLYDILRGTRPEGQAPGVPPAPTVVFPQPQPQQAQGPVVIPPVVPSGLPPGFVPQPYQQTPFQQTPGRMFPDMRTPTPDYSPVIPPYPPGEGVEPPVIPPLPPQPHGPPVIPDMSQYGAPPQPQPYTYRPHEQQDEGPVRPPPPSDSRSSSGESYEEAPHPIVIQPPGQPPIMLPPPRFDQPQQGPVTVVPFPPSGHPGSSPSRSSSSSSSRRSRRSRPSTSASRHSRPSSPQRHDAYDRPHSPAEQPHAQSPTIIQVPGPSYVPTERPASPSQPQNVPPVVVTVPTQQQPAAEPPISAQQPAIIIQPPTQQMLHSPPPTMIPHVVPIPSHPSEYREQAPPTAPTQVIIHSPSHRSSRSPSHRGRSRSHSPRSHVVSPPVIVQQPPSTGYQGQPLPTTVIQPGLPGVVPMPGMAPGMGMMPPMQGMMPGVPQTQPTIVVQGSRSRSSSRSRSRTPPQPIVIGTGTHPSERFDDHRRPSSRGRSRTRSRSPIIVGAPTGGQPTVLVQPSHRPSERDRRSRSRSPLRDRDRRRDDPYYRDPYDRARRPRDRSYTPRGRHYRYRSRTPSPRHRSYSRTPPHRFGRSRSYGEREDPRSHARSHRVSRSPTRIRRSPSYGEREEPRSHPRSHRVSRSPTRTHRVQRSPSYVHTQRTRRSRSPPLVVHAPRTRTSRSPEEGRRVLVRTESGHHRPAYIVGETHRSRSPTLIGVPSRRPSEHASRHPTEPITIRVVSSRSPSPPRTHRTRSQRTHRPRSTSPSVAHEVPESPVIRRQPIRTGTIRTRRSRSPSLTAGEESPLPVPIGRTHSRASPPILARPASPTTPRTRRVAQGPPTIVHIDEPERERVSVPHTVERLPTRSRPVTQISHISEEPHEVPPSRPVSRPGSDVMEEVYSQQDHPGVISPIRRPYSPRTPSIAPSRTPSRAAAGRPSRAPAVDEEVRPVPAPVPHEGGPVMHEVIPEEGESLYEPPSEHEAAPHVVLAPHEEGPPPTTAPADIAKAVLEPVQPPPPVSYPPPHAPSYPLELELADAERERADRFEDLERQANQLIQATVEGEDQRETAFRANEDERERLFLEHERRRDEEAMQRREEMQRLIDERLAAIPLIAPIPVPPPHGDMTPQSSVPPSPTIASVLEPGPEEHEETEETQEPLMRPPPEPDTQTIIETVSSAAQEAAARHAQEIRETIDAEREFMRREFEEERAERDRQRAQFEEERQREREDCDERVRALQAQIDSLTAELESERQMRMTEEGQRRDAERAEDIERADAVTNQLSDITNLVQQQREECELKKVEESQKELEKQERRLAKDAKWQAMQDMINQLLADRQADRDREEEERLAAADRPGTDAVLDQLRNVNDQLLAKISELEITVHNMGESHRADISRLQDEMLNAIRASANEQVPFNVKTYLDEFSKALASEVRMLLVEVGQLREQRKALQFEIGETLIFKAKHDPGGMFDPNYRPDIRVVPRDWPEPEAPAPEVPPAPEEPQQAPPAWRQVHHPSSRLRRPRRSAPTGQQAAPAPPAPVQPSIVYPPPGPQGMPPDRARSWATWQPDLANQPSPVSRPPSELLVPAHQSPPGLFGPRSPRESLHRT
ncbi:hypothetical protein ABKN59_006567 [Abortiporus biennis]